MYQTDLKYEIMNIGCRLNRKVGIDLKQKNKFQNDQKVLLKLTGETVTISKSQYVANMKRYSYKIKENPNTFYFEDEISPLND